MALTDEQWSDAVALAVSRFHTGTTTEAQLGDEITAATADWPTRTLSNADLAYRVSRVLSNLTGLVETVGAPDANVGTLGAMAFDKDALAFYGPKTEAGWGAARPLDAGPEGPSGPATELQVFGGFIQWRVVGDPDWINLIAVADLVGPAGPSIELQTNATHIQWRVVGAATWIDLIALSALKGDAGDNGWTPVLAIVSDGERRVVQVTDWTGGGGTKPTTGRFVGPLGLVDTAAEATDVRGPGGAGSGDMVGANNLSELTDVGAARNKLDVYSKAETDTALGTKADLVGGKIPVAQIPASAITDTFVVASQAEMLALTAQKGDVAIRSDLSKSFILQAEPAATLANWTELLTPTVVVPVFATVAEVWAGSVTDKIVSPSVLNAAMAPQALAITAGLVAVDGLAGINFDLASVNANITISNMTNKKVGRTGSLTIKLDGSVRTTSFGSDWKKLTDSPNPPTAANSAFEVIYSIKAGGVFYSIAKLP